MIKFVTLTIVCFVIMYSKSITICGKEIESLQFMPFQVERVPSMAILRCKHTVMSCIVDKALQLKQQIYIGFLGLISKKMSILSPVSPCGLSITTFKLVKAVRRFMGNNKAIRPTFTDRNSCIISQYHNAPILSSARHINFIP